MNRALAALAVLAGTALIVSVPACAGTSRTRRASVLEYLYPEGKEAQPPTDVELDLPVSLGLAFVPEATARGGGALQPGQQEALLERVRAAFAGTPEIERIELVPSSYVTPAGGFENVDQIRRALGIDLIALVSYDQTQFDDPNLASITYWTIVGAYVVSGNTNETHTLVDASAFDVDSRALLLHASGKSLVKGKATPVDLERSLREDRVEGFELAIDDLIANLAVALEAFRAQVKSGTVRGEGTPAVAVTADGVPVGDGGGAMAIGPLELLLACALLAVASRHGGRG